MEEIDLRELFNLFLSKILVIIIIVLIAVIIGSIYTFEFLVPKYTSATTFVLTTSESTAQGDNYTNSITTTDVTLNSKLVSTYSELVKSDKVLRQVISNLNIDVDEQTLKRNITVNAVSDTELIKVSVTSENAVYAAKIANEIAKVFSEMVKEIYNISNIYIVDEAEVQSDPSNIHHTKDIVIFAFVGLIIAIGYVLIVNVLDTTIKDQEDIEKNFGVPVLVSIPLIEKFEDIKGGQN